MGQQSKNGGALDLAGENARGQSAEGARAALRREAPLGPMLRAGGPTAAAALALLIVAALAYETGGRTLALSALIGALGGLALYHATFGFTGAWRRFQRERRGAGVRAQLLLIAIASLATLPLMAYGREIGFPAGGFVFPFGLASAIGAAMFGFGMQLGGGCGSGVLFTVGGGSTRMAVTLAGFLAGSVIYTGTAYLWSDLPRFGAVSMVRGLGAPGALLLTFAILGAIAFATIALERRRHGALEPRRKTESALFGQWSLTVGAAALALVVVLCFLVLGRPWGVTAAYPLWGAKIADAAGLGVAEWNAWKNGRIERSVFGDATSVMNFGVILGALGAAGLAGRFAPTWRLSLRDLMTAIVGGLLMGYGARLAWGCNIGGFVGGVVSGSAHGWWWLLFGSLGSVVGVWTRTRLGMDPPPTRAAAA